MSDSAKEADSARRLQAAAYRYNCQPCKQRKTKCDRVRPCASCQLRGTQAACYADDPTTTTTTTTTPTSAAAAQQQDEVEERPSKRARNSEATRVESPPSHHSASAIRQHIAVLRSTIDRLEAELGATPEPTSQTLPTSPQQPVSPSGAGDTTALTSSLRLMWEDVKHLFPPRRDVERILGYFLAEMTYIMIPVQEKQLWRAWERLSTSTSGVSRCMVASLLVCLASTSFLIPKQREHQLGLSLRMADQRDFWITSALALARSGGILPTQQGASQPWLNYVDVIMDTSLDRFGFETLVMRVFNLLGMSEIAYHMTGECMRRALRVNLFDEASPKAAEAITYDDPMLTSEDVLQMRRRIGSHLIVIERWSSLYTGRPPMIDDEAEALPVPDKAYWFEIEHVAYDMSRYVSKLRLLPNQLTALTSRKAGDWRTQRQRDQEAVSRVLDLDRGLCSLYDPDEPMAYFGQRSCTQILGELSQLVEGGHRMDDAELTFRHRQFAEALVLTSSWLSLRCLMTSNLMFLPWVGDPALRYYALNLARRLIELLPSIWMMASSAHVPFSSSWISRHVFLACTVLSVPILGQAQPHAALEESRNPVDPAASAPEVAGDKLDFEPSRLQRAHVFSKLSADASRVLDSSRVPASSSVDLDWFSGKLVEIAELFSKLAERGDQTAAINTKLIMALLSSRSELRDRVLHKLGQRIRSDEPIWPIESQRDLTTFVAAQGQSAPTPRTPQTQASASPARREGERSSLHDLASVVETVQEGTTWNLLEGFETRNKDHMLNNTDVLSTVPLLDTADWLAILDGVDIPL